MNDDDIRLHLFGQVLENLPDALVIIEAAPLGYPGPRVVYVNPAYERMTGYTAQEAIGQTIGALRGEAAYQRAVGLILRAVEQEAPLRVEWVRERKDGSEIDVEIEVRSLRDVGGAVQYFAVLQRDVTEHKRALDALRESEERFRTAFANAAIGFAITAPEGRFLDANTTYCALTGYTLAELREMTFQQIVHPEDLAENLPLIESMLAGERTDFVVRNRYRRKDSTPVWVQKSISLVRDTQGAPQRIIALIEDITEEKRADAERLRLQAVAQRRAVTLEAARRVALDVLLNRTGVVVLRHIAEAARTLVPARYAALGIADASGERLEEFITVGMTPAQERAIGECPRGKGVLGRLLRRAEPLRIDDLGSHPDAAGFPPHHPCMHTFLGVPIRRDEEILGSLYLTDRDDGIPFTEADEVAVVALADYAAVAIHYQRQLGQQTALMHGFINTLEEERRSVAYELHDGVVQYVMAAHTYLDTFASKYRAEGGGPRLGALDQGLQYLQKAVVESRRMVSGLRSLALEDMGLAGALEQLIREEEQRAGWETTEFRHCLTDEPLGISLETAVYRVAQEALANARKHARTSRVAVSLICQQTTDRLVLEVRDWGEGFDPQKRRDDYDHLGLHSMAERARLMKGAFAITSAPGQGTRIRAEFPLPSLS